MRRARAVATVLATVVTAGCGAGTTPVAQPSASPVPSTGPSASASASPSTPPSTAVPSATPTRTRTPTAKPSTTPTALPSWLAGSVVTRLPTTRRVVALTFDGGAGAQGATAVLDALRAANVPATFFLTGSFVAANPRTAAAIASRYLVGNHTATHPHLTRLGDAEVVRQVTQAGQQLQTLLGHSPRPWFRFPYGEYDARTLRIVHGLGYGGIGWTVDTRGWQGREAGTAADVVARVRAALRPGTIVLMHLGANPDDGTTFDADALPGIIAMARAQGYGFVALSG